MSDFRDTITNFTKNVTKQSGDLFKTTKLSMAVSTEQTALKNLYMEIGKKVHEIYQYGGTLGKFFDEKFLELEACERKIEELKEEISQIKGIRECNKCGKSAERTAEFCPKCGMRFGALGIEAKSDARPEQGQPGTHGYNPAAEYSQSLGTDYTASTSSSTSHAADTQHAATTSHAAGTPHTPTPTASPTPASWSSTPPAGDFAQPTTQTPALAPPPTPEPPAATPSTRRCRVCGMENDITTKFCLSCGRIVD